jgi:tRNA pseudouridine38-40 synthase
MPRFKLTLEYDGTLYCGWQAQENARTVAGDLMAALTAFCGGAADIQAAGRTDTGVHALAQVIHVDLAKAWKPGTVRDALNAHLRLMDAGVSVLDADAVDDDFHARFSAKARHYLYRILDRRPPAALDAKRVWHVPKPLDAGLMHVAAQSLVGHHDFTTFRAAHCQGKSPWKTLDVLNVTRVGPEIHIHAASRSFLHSQVRSMVGALKLAGEGKWDAADVARVLAARDRAMCPGLAPPWGLYFERVEY